MSWEGSRLSGLSKVVSREEVRCIGIVEVLKDSSVIRHSVLSGLDRGKGFPSRGLERVP